MDIKVIDPITDPGWLKLIENNPHSTIFHHPSWLKILKKQYAFQLQAVCLKKDDDSFAAGIPFCMVNNILKQKKIITLPFSDYCAPLYERPEEMEKMLDYLVNYSGNGDKTNIEIRYPVSSEKFQKHSGAVIHFSELQADPLKVFERFKKTRVQQAIIKAAGNGLKAEVSSSEADMSLFYKLHVATRKKLGMPVQPEKFFSNIYSELLCKDMGFIVVVRLGKVPVASGIFLLFKKMVTYKYSASDPRYMTLRPNNMMLWTGIKTGCERDYKIMDFGRTDIGNNGLREFKSGWDTREQQLFYSYFPEKPSDGKLQLIKNKIVSPIIRHSPRILCKLIGELGYRYFT